MDFSMLFERFELCDDRTITMRHLLKALTRKTLMKPWQTSLNKTPSQGGKEEQKKRTQVQAERTKPKVT
jgi:hypothetical protein